MEIGIVVLDLSFDENRSTAVGPCRSDRIIQFIGVVAFSPSP
ncbi:MAG: hypothetical protein ABI137_15960 [Antricoccus sp.]